MKNGVRAWNERVDTPTVIKTPSRVDESHRWSSDINEIVRRYAETGALPDPRGKNLGDVTHIQGKNLGQVIADSRSITAKVLEVRNARLQKEQEEREEDRKAGKEARLKKAAQPPEPPPVAPTEDTP